MALPNVLQRPVPTRARRALTLIELLAVIVLLALITGAITVNLGAMAATATLDETMQQIRHMDQRARLLARTERAASMTLREHTISLHHGAADTALRQITISDGTTIEFRSMSGAPRNAITYDATGRSPDTDVVIHDGDGRTFTIRIHGLTGAIEIQPEDKP